MTSNRGPYEWLTECLSCGNEYEDGKGFIVTDEESEYVANGFWLCSRQCMFNLGDPTTERSGWPAEIRGKQ